MTPSVERFEWVPTSALTRDAITLAGMLPLDTSGIVGLPRSGLIPATVIATHLHLPLFELTHEGHLNRLGDGSRGRILKYPQNSGSLAVIDDTVYSGAAMWRAREVMQEIGKPAVFAAVYSRLQTVSETASAVDFFAKALPSPHLLEWNFLNNAPLFGAAADPVYGAGVAVDLDGVIIHDTESGGPIGTPYLVPRIGPVRLIITGRPERHRALTESHLRSLKVRWSRLEMLPDSEEETTQSIARHKARHFRRSRCGFFCESDPLQAELIHYHSQKPVICPRAGKVWFIGRSSSPSKPLLPLSAVTPIFAPLIGKKIGLVHSPETGNAGDRLIEKSAEQILTRFGISFHMIEPDAPGGVDVILLFGGGNYGHECCKVEAARRASALATGKPCILLPQTAYGPEPRADYKAAFVRDVTSLPFIPGASLAPDLTLCYQPDHSPPPPTIAIGEFFTRSHEGLYKERGTDPRHEFTDPCDYLDFIAHHDEIHTDCLHVAICGLIARRTVTLYPTALHKQRSVWETWLRDLGCRWSGEVVSNYPATSVTPPVIWTEGVATWDGQRPRVGSERPRVGSGGSGSGGFLEEDGLTFTSITRW